MHLSSHKVNLAADVMDHMAYPEGGFAVTLSPLLGQMVPMLET